MPPREHDLDRLAVFWCVFAPDFAAGAARESEECALVAARRRELADDGR